ncbi:MAG: serine hydrolase domain-containing protein, partial [Acidobacteriota bacterium]
MAEWKVPGMAVAIVKDGQVILAEGYGLKDVKNNLKVTPQTIFAIGSSSKAFTATAMGILTDDGKLDWDKPVREYLPSFKLWDLFASERMTPRDLVCHRSGLPRHDVMWYNSPLSRKELFDRIQYLKPNKDFRANFQYQNLMFMTAGYLVGQLSGSTWEEFTKKKIFEPLGMNDSNFSVEESKKAA